MGRGERVDAYFRKQLRQERERRSWSQADVAKRLSDNGIPMYATTVAKIEAGERAVRIDEAAGIADLLEVPLDWLLGRQATGPGSEIRYALRTLQESAQKTVADLNSMLEALRDWLSDTFDLAFDGKDEVDADCKDTVDALMQAQSRLARIIMLELPEDEPVWQVDLDKFRQLIRDMEAQVTPLKRITQDEASDEA